MSGLDEPIRLAREALQIETSDRASLLVNLAELLDERYSDSWDVSDLEEAIQLMTKAIDLTTDEHCDKAGRLGALVELYASKRQMSGEISDIEMMIQLSRQAVDLTPASHPCWTGYANFLGFALGLMYQHQGTVEVLEEAIATTERVLDLTPRDDLRRLDTLRHLSDHLADRFSITEDIDDLERAIELAKESVDMSPDHFRAPLLDSYAMRLVERYEWTGRSEDLDGALQAARQAADLAPHDTLDRYSILMNLGALIRGLHESTGDMSHLEEAIQISRKLLQEIPNSNPLKSTTLTNLGLQLADRYLRTGVVADLEEAIQVGRQAMNSKAENDSSRSGLLDTLSVHLKLRYLRTGVTSDLEEAIDLSKESVRLAKDQLECASALNNLAIHLCERFERTANISDIQEATRAAREAVAKTPDQHPRFRIHQTTLSAQLDLEEAICIAKQVVEDAPGSDRDLPAYYDNLCGHLGDLFFRTGSLETLDESISIARKAADEIFDDREEFTDWLYSLSFLLGVRYSETGSEADINEAIQIERRCIKRIPLDHAGRAEHLFNLATLLKHQYDGTTSAPALEEAIKTAATAVDTTPDDHWVLSKFLNTLAMLLRARFLAVAAERAVEMTPTDHPDLVTGAIVDLERSIQLFRDDLASTPINHFEYAKSLNNLGSALDLTEAIEISQRAVDASKHSRKHHATYLSLLGPDLKNSIRTYDPHYGERSHALAIQLGNQYSTTVARNAVEVTQESHPDRALFLNTLGIQLNDLYLAIDAMEMAVKTSPDDHPNRAIFLIYQSTPDLQMAIYYHRSSLSQLSARQLTRIEAAAAIIQVCSRHSQWEEAFEAAQVAIGLNSDKQHALSQVVGFASGAAAVALQADKDIQDLREAHPELTEQFLRLREELQTPQSRTMIGSQQNEKLSRNMGSERLHEADAELDDVINKIRTQSGFESFLTSPDEASLYAAASSGPIVIINTTSYRCDAILITKDQIRVVHLAQLKVEELEEKARMNDHGSLETLEWLWDVITSPILDALGITEPPTSNVWPHIWWVPTGILSSFPLHAAGYHETEHGYSVLDRAMSSYSSSVKAILQGRQRRAKSPTERKALLVAMDQTARHKHLPFATKEVEMLKGLCKMAQVDAITPTQHKDQVMSHLPDCSIFHFAGHGSTNPIDPSQSSLLLRDWETDQLTVATLLEINIRERHPFLAYLSACGTGEIKDDRFVDENIHLASAFQLAGFRHVIGTLWGVVDEICVDMSRIAYQEILKSGMSDESLRHKWLSQPASACNNVSVKEVDIAIFT
ncbi:CHAT domain-containing protein [Dactylonectria macrodidyma]|uniref:CHAT domain-containing protein n=1 Tax=Dactylonectria macrodidyma TaxID=307937 RepID=A0A9P9F6V0_9HYPO|nr:CHAT domain-containing protein [Dactylonectria macrodidyma]